MVVLLDFGPQVLLTGDQEEDQRIDLASLNRPLALLKVAHHGSKKGTGADFLRRIRPERAALSVGAVNRYGHPAPEILARLSSAHINIDRTDTSGHLRYTKNPFPFGPQLLVEKESETRDRQGLAYVGVLLQFVWFLRRKEEINVC